jgi:23S rRNA G2069 N7-methylase RlmK/C1962 C5-methylase RlmI
MPHVPRITLKQGKEKPLLRGHPWVFSWSVAKIEGTSLLGTWGKRYSKDGQFTGMGYANPHSQIIFRLLAQEKLGLGPTRQETDLAGRVSLREAWFRGKPVRIAS